MKLDDYLKRDRNCSEERVLRVFSEEEIPRFRSSIEAHRNGVTVITSSRWSYTANPVPYTFGGTVFVTQERMADLGLEEVCKEGASVDVNVDIGTDWTKEAASRSRGRTCLGQTGGTFPAAHTRSRWSGAFGPSFAACAGLCDNHGRALGDGQVSTTESVFALNGKNVLLTGAAGGVGREAARAFTLVGARVLGADRNELGLQTMLGAGSLADMVAGDLTEAQVLDEILARWPDVDVLINNVGDGITAKLEDSTDELIEKMLAVNFRVTAGLCRRYIPGMAERRQGKVVNVSSILAMHPVPTVAAYSASKASLIAFTRSIALEYAHCGIQANVIAPGYLSGARQAEFFRSEHGEQFIRRFMPTGAPGKAGILNGPLLFLSSWMSDHITGHVLIVDGGYSIW
jgi:NAD(P)-dependent dehydrogenase (short-subunit alcohol dehydrogenase family)